jgi:hypothetical protein
VLSVRIQENSSEQVAEHQTPEGMVMVPKEQWDELLLQGKTNARMLNAVLDLIEKRLK